MKKNGFVFVESIIVLMVVALSMAMLLSSYSLVQRKTKEKEYYDKSSDKYLLYAISNLGTDDTCNYSVRCSGDSSVNFRSDRNEKLLSGADNPNYCKRSKLGRILYNCDKLMENMQVRSIYVVKDIKEALSSNNAVDIYDNGVIEYMKTLKKCDDENTSQTAPNNSTCLSPITYMIGVFERGNNNLYYASINISGNVKHKEVTVVGKNGWECENCNDSPKPAIANQKWVYYINDVRQKGLQEIPVTNSSNSRTAFFYFDTDGIIKTGWIHYGNGYHLFSPIDYTYDGNGNGNLDGWRVQSMSDSRLKATINGSIIRYFDKEGLCYSCLSGEDCKCSSSDVNFNINTLVVDRWSDYVCNNGNC